MEASGLAEKRGDSDSAVAKLDKHDALFVECTLSRVFPFPLQQVAAAVWNGISRRRLEWKDSFYSTRLRTADEFSVEYQVTSQVRRMSAKFHGRGVGGRRQAELGENFQAVWQMKTTTEGSAFRDLRVGLHDRSYLVLEPLDAVSGTSGTILKSCVQTWPQWEDEQRPPTNVLIDLVLSSCNRNVTTVLQTIENTLFDGGFTQK